MTLNKGNLLYTESEVLSTSIQRQKPINFIPLQFEHPINEKRYPVLPSNFNLTKTLTPLILFYELFSVNFFNKFVKSTNKYAVQNLADAGWPWYFLNINEFKIWLAIVIYIETHKILSHEFL
ncbi:12960_t:CDS:2 [Dentiscutata erythropus]|uniref:12960_t:CDS:1 n=1 Tax=Dentiscutata erythropus TaxID=1348616 RepID=A0A9N9DAH5_9GLOM|nr:12960_t:CDS:2 [Dentiscutata erythropus]